jgi:hypothetical protein
LFQTTPYRGPYLWPLRHVQDRLQASSGWKGEYPTGKDIGFGASLRRGGAKTLSSKFHLLPLLKIPAKSVAAYKLKADEAFYITEQRLPCPWLCGRPDEGYLQALREEALSLQRGWLDCRH